MFILLSCQVVMIIFWYFLCLFVQNMVSLYGVIMMKKSFEIIKDLREDKDLKQKDVADYLKMSRTTYNHYELGHTALTEDVIIKLSKFYDVSPNIILNYQNQNEISDVKTLELIKLIEKENIDVEQLISLIQLMKKCIKSY